MGSAWRAFAPPGASCSCGHEGMGDLIVYDSEVRAKKDEVDLDVKNLVLTANGCGDKVTHEESMAIDAFLRDWINVYNRPIPFWGASAEMVEVLGYQRRAVAWRNELGGRCELVGPAPLPPPEKPPGPTELASEWIGMLKIAIPAAAVIAVAVLAAPFVLEYAGARKSKA